ncbi:ATP-binding protein [Streptomyces sp. ACA25]|uniref:ATP-binding protein n=1 Tax=Streptomyces sp. ACA25 TaxID=3022596 RepID=UPI0023077FB3|nr:ATP-binding protein [Streptomyces sp. ACA25]MDB1089935.1 ATP-binding protein [Streptomyces sp. ACA25]
MTSRTPSAPDLAGRHDFAQLFSSTRRGARLARLMAAQQLDSWGHPYDSTVSRTAALLVGELASNAVLHGRLPGRDFRLRLREERGVRLLIEVTDAVASRWPDTTAPPRPPAGDCEGGRGLLLVEAHATRWGVRNLTPLGKTVWAEIDLLSTTPPADQPSALPRAGRGRTAGGPC